VSDREAFPGSDAAAYDPGDEGVGGAGDEGVGEEQPSSRRTWWLIGGGIVAVLAVLLAVAGYRYVATKDDATTAAPGDCLTALHGTDHIDISNTKVDCGDSAAAFKVLGIVADVHYADANGSTCAKWSAANVPPIWIANSTDIKGPGKVVCLQAIK
jgi:hypothetical protein